jgi:1-deoxy-D-xylulose-5-phosphate reductoisomerase
LDVLRRYRDRYQVHSLVAGRNVARLAEQAAEFRPRLVVIEDPQQIADLQALLPYRPDILTGAAGRLAAATHPDVEFVLSAIVGVAGLEATYEAVRRGTRVGLANKETLVAGGALVIKAAQQSGAEIIPVDSEHNGAHQCLRAGRRSEVTRLILTASGGPFRTWTAAQMDGITPSQALKHPTWKMGQRITIDSATLMNKGFEVMEACWLFGFSPSEVDVVVHPQSQVHAMVEFNDGSLMLQACATDMRMPIQYALTYPAREEAPVPTLAWNQTRQWDFHEPDWDRFPLLSLAYECQNVGGSAGTTLNAADEIAVEAFLEERIPFSGITEVIRRTLEFVPARRMDGVSDLLEIDRESREMARKCVTACGARA